MIYTEAFVSYYLNIITYYGDHLEARPNLVKRIFSTLNFVVNIVPHKSSHHVYTVSFIHKTLHNYKRIREDLILGPII